LEVLSVFLVSGISAVDISADLGSTLGSDSSGASNFLYCAIMLLQVLHLYSPFSNSVTPSPRSSLGFSKLMLGDPS
jgi:hypothetical protein